MTSRTHDVAAITFLSVAFFISPEEKMTITTLLLAVLFNQIGGILPDIDQPTAPFWKNLPAQKYIGKIVDKALFGGHRFLTHSIIGFGIFSFISYLILNLFKSTSIDIAIILIAFALGYISHLVLDSLTKEGVPWLLPITKKLGFPPIKKFRITTGSAVENLIILPGLVVIEVIIIAQNYDFLLIFFKNYLVK